MPASKNPSEPRGATCVYETRHADKVYVAVCGPLSCPENSNTTTSCASQFHLCEHLHIVIAPRSTPPPTPCVPASRRSSPATISSDLIHQTRPDQTTRIFANLNFPNWAPDHRHRPQTTGRFHRPDWPADFSTILAETRGPQNQV